MGKTTGESLFRELVDGVVFDVSVEFCRQLLRDNKKPEIFKEIGRLTNFEVCVGRNGRIWVKGMDAILIMNLLKKVQERRSEEQQLELVRQLAPLFAK